MAAALAVCTKEEQRTVIQFFCYEVFRLVGGGEIHRRLLPQYSDTAEEVCMNGSKNLKMAGQV